MNDEQKLKATVVVHMTLSVDFKINDSGYLGTDASVEEHIKAAREAASSTRLFLQRGGTQQQEVPFKTEFVSVILTPKET